MGRLLHSIGASSQTTAYAYDKNDNVTGITDPLSGVTAQAYDALDRVISSTDPATKVTAYGYDNQDHLTSVTDARSVQTAYVYDGFGRVIQAVTPDGGTTVYHYDPADNLTEKTDGRSVVTDYSYDALNRITAKTFAAATSENVAYSYDDSASGHFGIGRLATITDESGSTAFIYDSRGNVVQETRTIAGTAYVTGYAYDVADRLTQMTYPSGRIVAYARDTLGRVTAVTTQASAADAPATIASNIAYKPFGPIASMLYGNGLTRTYTYDGDYRLTALATGDVDTSVQDLSYGYDAADNITSIADALASDRSQAFTYDSLFRLKTAAATGTYGSIAYNYDDIGNRTSVVDGAGTESYSTDTSSNRLLSTTSSSGTRSFTYDNAGNITADATGSTTYGLAYNKANRLSEVSLNGTPDTDYLYNALGERVKKAPAATPTAGTRFHYDRDGKLIAESDSTGAVIREYAWLDGLPIGEFTNAGAGTPPGKTQLDDSDSGATFTGSWTTTTAGSGYIGSSYHKFDPSSGGAPAGGTVIDNTSPQFSTLGAWATATSPTGFEGSDYRVRNAGVDGFGSDLIVDNADATGFATTGTWSVGTYFENYNGNFVYKSANGLTPEVTIVDNTDTTHVQQTGGWTVANDCCGHYNGDSLQHTPNQPLTGAIVVDNGSAQSSFTGTWSSYYIGNGQTVGSDFAYKYVPDGTSTYTWTPSLPAAGQYRVYAHWYAWSGNATNAPYTIYYDGGSTVVQVNQQSNGGTWNLLGTFAMTPGQNQRVMMTQQGNGQIIADAIEFAPVAAPPNQVTWTPDIPQSADYSVYAWWKGWQANAAATYTIYHGSGSTSVTVNQNNNGAQWNLLGVFPLAPGQNHRVVLTDVSSDYQQILADAVRLIRVGAPPPSAIWTPTLPARDRYDVSAKWYNYPYQATNAPFTVYHEAGSTTVAEDEANGDASWHLLGTFVMAPGENHRVVLTDVANGGVTGDAVKLSAHHEAKLATWSIPGSAIAQTGNYMVYAKWPALPGTGATDATYTVSYQGGSQSVSVNQRANGGQWNLLGQFAFSAGGSGYKVDLADSANGKVAADAIYIVQSGAPAGAAFTWTPPFPSAGAYQVYARWPGSSANTAAAQYTVTRDGGTSTVTLNQKQNGGAWMLLGNYNFTPSSGQKVMLAASSDGTTIADAMLFVGAGAQPANLLYVHADHLGSPQKMTDASQAIAWDGVFDPFGKEVAITGLAAMPKRFPGQYADDETGYSYNLLRYYDPTIARYLQRDPIGLAGGINGYGYASGNPIRRFDPTGEMSVGGSSGGAVLIGMTAAVLAAIACEATSQMQQQYYDHHRFHLPRIPNIGDLIPGVRPWLWNENANGDGTSSPGDPPANGGSGGQGGSTTDQGGSGGQGGAQNGQDAANTATDGSTPGKSSSSEQYNKGGGAGQANSDFDKIAGNNNPVKDHGNGIRSTELQDGTTVSVRPSSSEGSPTVQINRPGEPPIKVRYK
ncbi:MAG TPA: RHS repeat-associated core domain-containing protein [Candidatus Angelobacter sp.]|nr:RHS repeat-associated core domain-containing protein [Candidatus Angelobacter sp.]